MDSRWINRCGGDTSLIRVNWAALSNSLYRRIRYSITAIISRFHQDDFPFGKTRPDISAKTGVRFPVPETFFSSFTMTILFPILGSFFFFGLHKPFFLSYHFMAHLFQLLFNNFLCSSYSLFVAVPHPAGGPLVASVVFT